MHEVTSKKSEAIDRAYSSEPWWYDIRGFLILTFSYQTTLPAQVKHFANNIKENHLEVAIGSGTLFSILLKWRSFKKQGSSRIVGFDYAERMLAGARRRFKERPEITLVRADAAQMPWSSNVFDSVNAANCIHCFPEVEKSLSEIHRVLKVGGTFAGNCLINPRGHSFFDRLAHRINMWGMKKGILHRPFLVSEIKGYLERIGFKITYEKYPATATILLRLNRTHCHGGRSALHGWRICPSS